MILSLENSDRIDGQPSKGMQQKQWEQPKVKEFSIEELTENSPGGGCDGGTCS